MNNRVDPPLTLDKCTRRLGVEHLVGLDLVVRNTLLYRVLEPCMSQMYLEVREPCYNFHLQAEG